MLRRITQSLKRRRDKSSIRFLLNILLLSFNQKVRVNPPVQHFELIRQSGIFGNGKFDTLELLRAWEKTDVAWSRGYYNQANNDRREILEEVYDYNEVNAVGYFPPALSLGFTGPIGHVGILGVHIRAQELGVLPPGKRMVPVLHEKAKREVTRSLLARYNPMYFKTGGAWGEFPNMWHASERLQMMRANDGFLDLYEVFEKTYSAKLVDRENPIVSLSDEYKNEARNFLHKFGLPQDAWFVSLHIRNEGPEYLRRNQPNENYDDAIRYLSSLGGWVIRIGDPSMKLLAKHRNLIDLIKEDSSVHYHSYILASAKFHIGTISGPTWIPPLFGVPVLVTNATSLARNLHTMSQHTIFLPKHIVSRKREWTFAEILDHPEGYAEDEFKPGERDYYFQPNSSLEILEGVKEIIARIETQDEQQSKYQNRVELIRSEFKAIGKGQIANSFIEHSKIDYLRF